MPMNDTIQHVEGRELRLTGDYLEWVQTEPPLLRLDREDYAALIYEGVWDRPAGGYTLYWTDAFGLNDWGEHFTDLATALARLAALERGVLTDAMFKDGPVHFPRWSENFFTRALTAPMIPGGDS